MYKTTQRKWVTALCIAAVAGCASDWNDRTTDNSGYTSSGSAGSGGSSGTGSSGGGVAGSAGSSGAMSSGSGTAAGAMGSAAQPSYGMVQAIDQMQRQDLGVGVAGAAAAGGSTGAASDLVYRVSVRMDDGSSQTIVVDAMPPYQVGDRVRYNNGALSAY